jgi:CRP/FNR family transcriptional regulator
VRANAFDLSQTIPRLPFARGLPAEVLDALIAAAEPLCYQRRQLVMREGAPAERVYFVLSGALVVEVRDHAVAPQVTGFLFDGDFFGVVHARHYSSSVRALVDTHLAAIERTQFEALCDAHPELQHAILRVASNELAAAQDHLLTLGRRSARERVASFLYQLDRRRNGAGPENGGEKPLWLPMRRSDIADHLGLTLETVSRVMSDLQKKRIIAVESRHRIRICDRAALHEIAEPA